MMNNYMDYYGYMDNLNQMSSTNKNIIDNNPLAEPYVGFIRGNMFNELYSEYKGYTPKELNPNNDKEYIQLLLQMYGFAAHDLGLYLDINPGDMSVIKKRAEFVKMYNDTLAQYEKNYGPITSCSEMLSTSPWAWDTKTWPWEGMK